MSLADKFNIPKTLLDYITGVMKEETEYQAKVKALMAKKGIKSLGDLSPDEKKAFFSQLDSMHQGKNEQVHPEDEKDPSNKLQKSGTKKWLTKDYKDGKPVSESEDEIDIEDDKKKKKKKDDDEEDEVNDVEEASSPAQQAAIAIAMKKDGKKPKDVQEAPVGGGTSIKSSEAEKAKATADRAKLTMQAAQLRIKQAKEREALSKKKQSIKSEFDPLEESFSDAQIAKLKAEYSKINTIDPSGDGYKKLTAMLDKLDKPTLEKLAGAGIKFVSGLAKNRANRMKNEELSPKQKALDKNKNGKIDGSDLAKLRNEEDEPTEFKQGGKPLADKFKRAFEKLGIKADVKIKTVGNVSTNEAVVKGKGYDNPDNERKGPEGKVPMTSLMPGHSDKAARLAAVQAKGKLVKGKAQSASQKEEVELEESDLPSSKDTRKTVMVRHKTSGKELKIDASAVAKYKAMGYELMKEEVELDEAKSDYEIYHKDFSTAVQHAIKTAEKRGYKVDDDDWDRKVAMGPRKPSEGKTNSYSITLMDKNGKPVKKALQMQVYNKGGQNPYELNMYIEDFDVNAIFSEAMKKEKEATAKDKNKSVKSGDKLSGKQEPVEIQPELKEEK